MPSLVNWELQELEDLKMVARDWRVGPEFKAL